jgi:hypothetical protein
VGLVADRTRLRCHGAAVPRCRSAAVPQCCSAAGRFSFLVPSVIDRAVKALRAEGIATFDASEDEVSLAPSAPDGFRVTLRIRGPDAYEVHCDGWIESFPRPEDAFDCFLFALSDRCRLRITLRGATPVRWQVLRREYGIWALGPVRRRRLVPFWRRSRVEHRQNTVFRTIPPDGRSVEPSADQQAPAEPSQE